MINFICDFKETNMITSCISSPCKPLTEKQINDIIQWRESIDYKLIQNDEKYLAFSCNNNYFCRYDKATGVSQTSDKKWWEKVNTNE